VDGPDARALLDDTERLRRRARADRHPSSVPLLVFASLTLFSAPFSATPQLWTFSHLYWVVAGPVGFLLIGWWYRGQAVRSGVGQGRGSYLLAGASVLAALVLVPFLLMAPLPAVAAGLVALQREDRGR
jgi:hypothetical protein